MSCHIKAANHVGPFGFPWPVTEMVPKSPLSLQKRQRHAATLLMKGCKGHLKISKPFAFDFRPVTIRYNLHMSEG